jgi:hypothetical protein
MILTESGEMISSQGASTAPVQRHYKLRQPARGGGFCSVSLQGGASGLLASSPGGCWSWTLERREERENAWVMACEVDWISLQQVLGSFWNVSSGFLLVFTGLLFLVFNVYFLCGFRWFFVGFSSRLSMFWPDFSFFFPFFRNQNIF